MIHHSKIADERREAGRTEIWCLHGAVGVVADWRESAADLARKGVGSRAVDLWRFLEAGSCACPDFGRQLNIEAGGEIFRGDQRALLGYSMGGRLALHALVDGTGPWQSAVIVSAHPGLEAPAERASRLASDSNWASRAMLGDWQNFLDAWSRQPVLDGELARDAETQNRLKLRRREIARGLMDWSLGAQLPLWDRLSEIKIPVLWIAGERDQKFRALAERAASLTPRGSLSIAPSAGHRVPWDTPDWFTETVCGFLQRGTA